MTLKIKTWQLDTTAVRPFLENRPSLRAPIPEGYCYVTSCCLNSVSAQFNNAYWVILGVPGGAVFLRHCVITGRSRVRFPMRFFIDIILQPFKKMSTWWYLLPRRGKGGQCVRLTLPPSCADRLEFLEASASGSPTSGKALPFWYGLIMQHCIVNVIPELSYVTVMLSCW